MYLSIVFSSDDHYAQQVGVSMLSLFENNRHFEAINVYLLENGITIESKKRLEVICKKYKRNIQFIDFSLISKRLNLNIGNSISISSYARLFLASLLTEVDKVLYLDCDSVINQSLDELWSIDITGYYVAGVSDTVSNNTKTRINLNETNKYINAGMLLINLKKWREEDIENSFIKFIDSYGGTVFHHDQGTINGVLNKKMLVIHPKFNAMTTFFTMSKREIMQYYGLKDYYSDDELREAKTSPVFIHFTPAFVNRPWIKGCKHPLAALYYKYLALTPWKGAKINKDTRSIGEKLIAILYNYLPFSVAHNICNFIFR